MRKQEMDLLVDVLLDKTARPDEREDAAMNLADYTDKKALSALIKIASDKQEEDLWEVCGESVATIMYKLDEINMDTIDELAENARVAAINYLESD